MMLAECLKFRGPFFCPCLPLQVSYLWLCIVSAWLCEVFDGVVPHKLYDAILLQAGTPQPSVTPPTTTRAAAGESC